MKKILSWLLTLCLIMSIMSSSVFATSKTINTEEDFYELVKSSVYYENYKKFFISNDESSINSHYDEDSDTYSYSINYELDVNFSENTQIMLPSHLMFTYDQKSNTAKTILTDNSKIISEEKIYVTLLETNEQEIIDTNTIEGFDEFINSIIADAESNNVVLEPNEDTKSNNENQRVYIELCWKCTQFVTGGGDWRNPCLVIGGVACSTISAFSRAGGILCAFGVAVECYTPQYKFCSDGYWTKNNCPQRE